MVYSIKGSRKIKKAKSSKSLRRHGGDCSVVYSTENSFGRTVFGIGRLMFIEEAIVRKMFIESFKHSAL